MCNGMQRFKLTSSVEALKAGQPGVLVDTEGQRVSKTPNTQTAERAVDECFSVSVVMWVVDSQIWHVRI